jgi:hypothetical protein
MPSAIVGSPAAVPAVALAVTALATAGITGRHALVLKIVAGRDIGRLSTVEVR